MKNCAIVLIISLFFIGCTHKEPIHIIIPEEPILFNAIPEIKNGAFCFDRRGAENLKKNKELLKGYIKKLKERIKEANAVFDEN